MLDDFIQHTLAQVDDLAELKVSLVALRLLDLKQTETASITARELAAHPSLRDGLGFAPQITLDSALQRAVARGTLLRLLAESLDEPRYFLNTEASRRTIDTIEMAEARRNAARSASTIYATGRLLHILARDIEWLEVIDAYPISSEDEFLVEEWLAQGYSQTEIVDGVRETLNMPRPKGAAPRTLQICAAQVMARPPDNPSAYYRSILTRMESPPDEIIAFHELAGRWPNGHEFNLAQAAVGIFGAHAAIQMMRRVISPQRVDIDALIPLLAEQQEAELALARAQAIPDLMVSELIQLYESSFGLPPTSRIAQDISALASEISDMTVWHGVFQYAAAQNKRDWAYVRRLLLNPSPTLFEPLPTNETARLAFLEYKRRVSRGVLDPSVAREINELAQRVTDISVWTQAIDKAAAANALNWNYIRTVLTGPPRDTSEVKDGRRKHIGGTRQRGIVRRPQVEESTEEEREAARERARQRIAERAKRRTAPDERDDVPSQ